MLVTDERSQSVTLVWFNCAFCHSIHSSEVTFGTRNVIRLSRLDPLTTNLSLPVRFGAIRITSESGNAWLWLKLKMSLPIEVSVSGKTTVSGWSMANVWVESALVHARARHIAYAFTSTSVHSLPCASRTCPLKSRTPEPVPVKAVENVVFTGFAVFAPMRRVRLLASTTETVITQLPFAIVWADASYTQSCAKNARTSSACTPAWSVSGLSCSWSAGTPTQR